MFYTIPNPNYTLPKPCPFIITYPIHHPTLGTQTGRVLACASIITTLPWIPTYPYPSIVIPYPSTYPTLPTVGKILLPTFSIYPTYPINVNSAYTSPSDSPNRVRRTQAYILKPKTTSVIWPGNYLELALPSDLQPECTLAIESKTNNVKFLNNWPPPSIIVAKFVYLITLTSPCVYAKMNIFAKSVSPQNSPVTVLTVTYNYPSSLLLLQNSILTPSLLIPTRYFLSRTKPSFVI